MMRVEAAALCTLLLASFAPAAAAPPSARLLQVRTICDDDGRCYDAGPRFRDRDDDAPPPRRRFDPDDDDRPRPPPRHRRYDPDDDDDRPPPPRHRRDDPDDDR